MENNAPLALGRWQRASQTTFATVISFAPFLLRVHVHLYGGHASPSPKPDRTVLSIVRPPSTRRCARRRLDALMGPKSSVIVVCSTSPSTRLAT
jgi:hypothetical protein